MVDTICRREEGWTILSRQRFAVQGVNEAYKNKQAQQYSQIPGHLVCIQDVKSVKPFYFECSSVVSLWLMGRKQQVVGHTSILD